MSGALSTLIVLGALVIGGMYIWKDPANREFIQSLFRPGTMPSAAPRVPATGGGGGAAPTPGNLNAKGGQTIFPSTGKKWKAVDSGKKTRNYASGGSSGTTQWDIKGVGNVTNLEVTTYVNVGGCGDEVSLKVYGPSHSGSNCCWLIMNVDCNSGKFQLGGEGPHPDTNKTNLGTGQSIGSIKNKEVGIKLVTYKSGGSYTAIGYADTGSGWKEMLRKTFSQFGSKKKSSTPHGSATIQFRTDCSGVKYSVAEAAEISPSAAGYAHAYFTYPSTMRYCRGIKSGQCYDDGDSFHARVYTGNLLYLQQPQYSPLYYCRQYQRNPSYY